MYRSALAIKCGETIMQLNPQLAENQAILNASALLSASPLIQGTGVVDAIETLFGRATAGGLVQPTMIDSTIQ